MYYKRECKTVFGGLDTCIHSVEAQIGYVKFVMECVAETDVISTENKQRGLRKLRSSAKPQISEVKRLRVKKKENKRAAYFAYMDLKKLLIVYEVRNLKASYT